MAQNFLNLIAYFSKQPYVVEDVPLDGIGFRALVLKIFTALAPHPPAPSPPSTEEKGRQWSKEFLNRWKLHEPTSASIATFRVVRLA